MKRIFSEYCMLVILALLMVQYIIYPLVDQYTYRFIEDQFESYYLDFVKGPFFITTKYLEPVPEEEVPNAIKSLQKEFGFPINTLSMNDIDLEPDDANKLKAGETIIQKDGSVFYKRLGNTKWIIKMGPFKDFDDVFYTWRYELVVWVTVICFVVLLSLMWAFPFWKHLKKIMEAAEHFGQGDFSARSDISKRSSLKQISDTFNNMAERIGGLIESHKLLVNAISHELRTPITRLRFGMELLESSKSEEDKKKYTSGIFDDVDDLESLVSELLTYSAFDKQYEYLKIERITVNDWIKDIISKAQLLLEKRNIELSVQNDIDYLSGDSKLLARALENLILNAVRYSKKRIMIRTEKTEKTTRISVIDDGPGIPENEKERIFEPFVRIDKSRNRASGGYGLGLAIVRQIMEKHSGRAFIEQSEEGSVFVLEWPGELKIS